MTSMTCVIFHDLPGLENGLTKGHDYCARATPWVRYPHSRAVHKLQQ